MERLMTLQDIQDLPDGTLIAFISTNSYFGDKQYGTKIDDVDGEGKPFQLIVFDNINEAIDVDIDLFNSLALMGVQMADGKVRALLYKEI